MGRAQLWIILLLSASIILQVIHNQQTLSPAAIQKTINGNPKIIGFWIGGLIGLVLLSGPAPELSIGMAILIFLGAALIYPLPPFVQALGANPNS